MPHGKAFSGGGSTLTRRRVRRAWCWYHINDSRVNSSTEAKKPLSKMARFRPDFNILAQYRATPSVPEASYATRTTFSGGGGRLTRRRVRRARCCYHINDSRVNSSTESKKPLSKMARFRPDFNILAQYRATPSVPEAQYASREDAFWRWRQIRRDGVCGAHRVCIIQMTQGLTRQPRHTKLLSKHGPFSARFRHTCSLPSDSERARGSICLTGRRFLAVVADSTRRRVRRASCLFHINDSRINSSTEAKKPLLRNGPFSV